jgi:serine/threonine protein kinase
VAAQISDALDHLHRRGAAHKDVKPDNIFEGLEGMYKLGDLGLTTVVSPSLPLEMPTTSPASKCWGPTWRSSSRRLS